jgi:hypothetical protein
MAAQLGVQPLPPRPHPASRLPRPHRRIHPAWSRFVAEDEVEGTIRCRHITQAATAQSPAVYCGNVLRYAGTISNGLAHLKQVHKIVVHPDNSRLITLDELAKINSAGGPLQLALKTKPSNLRIVAEYVVMDNIPVTEPSSTSSPVTSLPLLAPVPHSFLSSFPLFLDFGFQMMIRRLCSEGKVMAKDCFSRRNIVAEIELMMSEKILIVRIFCPINPLLFNINTLYF